MPRLTKTLKSCDAGSRQKRLTIEQKRILLAMSETMPSATRLAAWATDNFPLARPLTEGSVRYLLKHKEQLPNAPDAYDQLHNLRRATILAFDALLVELIEDFDDEDTVTGDVAIVLARYLAERLHIHPTVRPKFSQGWLQKFKNRNGLSFRRRHGEAASVNAETVRAGQERIQRIVAQYGLQDVYTMDETAFYYRMAAAGTLARQARAGRKRDKTRLTLATAANADGSDKLPLLIIGKTRQSRSLQGYEVDIKLDIDYTHSKSGWMTSAIYCDWLACLDDRMRDEGRHILLLVDNVSSHDDSGVRLTNVRVERLPPNTTAVLQPMDQGIIASLKKRYMKKKTMATLHNFLASRGNSVYTKKKPIDMLSAFTWCADAWEEMPAELISNCWRHSGLIPRIAMQIDP